MSLKRTISRHQYMNINTGQLGLRSGSSADDIGKAASYSMTLKDSSPYNVPDNWRDTLDNTIKEIKGFGNAEGRFLLIVSPSHGTSEEYRGCFPKCSSKPTKVIASTPIGDKSDEDLANWVIDNIQV